VECCADYLPVPNSVGAVKALSQYRKNYQPLIAQLRQGYSSGERPLLTMTGVINISVGIVKTVTSSYPRAGQKGVNV
jgi:hypothetical protein